MKLGFPTGLVKRHIDQTSFKVLIQIEKLDGTRVVKVSDDLQELVLIKPYQLKVKRVLRNVPVDVPNVGYGIRVSGKESQMIDRVIVVEAVDKPTQLPALQFPAPQLVIADEDARFAVMAVSDFFQTEFAGVIPGQVDTAIGLYLFWMKYGVSPSNRLYDDIVEARALARAERLENVDVPIEEVESLLPQRVQGLIDDPRFSQYMAELNPKERELVSNWRDTDLVDFGDVPTTAPATSMEISQVLRP